MKANKIIFIVISLVIIVFIGLWLIDSGILFKDEISSRAKKVFSTQRIGRRYYGE